MVLGSGSRTGTGCQIGRATFGASTGRLVPAVFALVLGACAHGVEPSAEGPARVIAATDKDASFDPGTDPTGGNAGSTANPQGSSGNGGSDGPGSAGMGGLGGSSNPEVDAGDNAGGSSNGGAPGAGGAGGLMIVDAGLPAVPTGVTVGAQTMPSELRAPSTGGAVYSDVCPTNQVLIGFKGTIDAAGGQTYLRSVQGVCGTLAINGSGPYTVAVTQAGQLLARQTASAVAQSAMCSSNQMVIGFGGRSGGFIDALSFRCAPLTIGGVSPNFTLGFGAVTTTGIIGGATGGSGFADVNCASGAVAVGQAPHAGAAIDAFGLECATPSLVIK